MSYSTCNFTKEIDENECIGDSLTTINANFSALDVAVCNLSPALTVNDSQTIDLSLTTGKTLSADVRPDSIRYSNLASWQTLSASPTLSAEAVQPRVAKAWGSIEKVGGTFTAYNSFNVLSVTDGGTKRKTVRFITPLISNKYVVFITWMYANGETHYVTVSPGIEENQTTSQFIINHYDESQIYTRINFVVFDY